ncbi:hypothetical protein F3Y22_tig00116943pilonHSYRG00002 [Hibiscus syriacus]|uniref:Glycine-rich protein n=1 Tax=Hibiscus syriacus TaxID=106335 RepID=A0A6A2WLS8_HIBSY|nr:uncharacterized protein LOC120188313 [Hibiscus syriacus]XP_039047701.1 uncharacterized protein LOC120188313 [Hibiscus syriacus]KAE8661012.1 hypothetical protein F3Y22_tig00116943pilonHSYRG00002 [Hibiscus syriacus]
MASAAEENVSSDAAGSVSEGPVLSFINKRLRALRKKYNRILQMEESLSHGKPLNKEQEEVLRSKPAVSALIDELEKLRQPLSVAVSEEISLALQRQTCSLEETTSEAQLDKTETQEQQSNEHDHAIEDLLNLLYFGLLFDVKSQNDFISTMLTRTHERGCCLTYDYVTDDATDLLSEKDLDLIAKLSGKLTSRPADSSLSHKNALHHCVNHAKLWLSNSDQPIDHNADVSYAELRQRLNKIKSLDYFTTTPEIKDPVEVAAAAAGAFTSFQVPVPISVPVQVEDSAGQYQPKEDEASNYQESETGDNQYSSTEELHQDNLEKENHAEDITVQQEHDKLQADNGEAKEQQYVPGRPYQNQRGGRGTGGGRGGRISGRGGVTYQNGHNQYHDQPDNSYSRNQHNNRGRGGRGRGHAYNNQGSDVQGGNPSADVGVAS